jgi:hypothetical protein
MSKPVIRTDSISNIVTISYLNLKIACSTIKRAYQVIEKLIVEGAQRLNYGFSNMAVKKQSKWPTVAQICVDAAVACLSPAGSQFVRVTGGDILEAYRIK